MNGTIVAEAEGVFPDASAVKPTALDELRRARASSIERINNIRAAVDRIDGLIERLAFKRRHLTEDSRIVMSGLVGIQHFLSTPAELLVKEFRDKHFDSDVVKRAVGKVRELFFDDGTETCRGYRCVDIRRSYSSDSGIVRFVFSNGTREFGVGLPETCDGMMNIIFRRGESFLDCTPGTLDVDELRRDIRDYMAAADVGDFDSDRGRSFDQTENTLLNRISGILRPSVAMFACGDDAAEVGNWPAPEERKR